MNLMKITSDATMLIMLNQMETKGSAPFKLFSSLMIYIFTVYKSFCLSLDFALDSIVWKIPRINIVLKKLYQYVYKNNKYSFKTISRNLRFKGKELTLKNDIFKIIDREQKRLSEKMISIIHTQRYKDYNKKWI